VEIYVRPEYEVDFMRWALDESLVAARTVLSIV
jgi:hypothetical protein